MGKMSVAHSRSAICASSSQSLAALFGGVEVASLPSVKTGIRLDDAVRRLFRADRCRTSRWRSDAGRLDLSRPMPSALAFGHALRFPAPNIAPVSTRLDERPQLLSST